MPKQIKIGFDRTISPQVNAVRPLYDIITSSRLVNENGDPLFTEELGPLDSFFVSDKSLSVSVNNQKNPVLVEEQFPETTQVSSSLLGIPRSEQQLGLFSDVSTYGFNNNIWEYFRNFYPRNPQEWVERKNKTYGPRFTTNVVEVADEQAIAIESFPVSWFFPYGPSFEGQGLYRPELYAQYIKFLDLGEKLYNLYFYDEDEVLEKFAVENFLPPNLYTLGEVNGKTEVIYNESLDIDYIFEEIEKWTMSWIKLKNDQLYTPYNVKVTSGSVNINIIDTVPGYPVERKFFGQIKSRKSFRYQPGRISGFTFGLKCSSDEASKDNIIEWGCANDTDEYMFQVKGPNFSIVRRSTVPLPEKNLNDMGLTKDDQILIPETERLGYPYIGNKFDPNTGEIIRPPAVYELVIKRDFFNGDQLNGDGPSGYILNVERVTMYKIEFSWYGAIGAKFYAYIPVGNGEARWVLLHTLVIENKLGQPCLNDPYFNFRYLLQLNDTTTIVAPQYVYKYGASYYIDGGDEGSTTIYSTTSEVDTASPLNTKSILGIIPKDFIANKEGELILNKKDIIPEQLSVTTDNPVRIDIIDCEGCPGGFGHYYTPSLHNGIASTPADFYLSADGTQILYTDPTKSFTQADIGKKVLGDGIYSTYIGGLVNGVQNAARIARKLGTTGIPSTSSTYQNTKGIIFANNAVKTRSEILNGAHTFNLRLSGYEDSIAVCTIPLTKPSIDVTFLNIRADDGRSFADFFIGITSKVPSIGGPGPNENKILLDNAPVDSKEILYGEWTNFRLEQDVRGYEQREDDERYGLYLEVDPQIPAPRGTNSGRCSKISFKVSEFEVEYKQYTTSITLPNNVVLNGHFLTFTLQQGSAILNLDGFAGGQIGIFSGGAYIPSQVTFVGDKITRNTQPTPDEYYIEISGPLPSTGSIAFRTIRAFSRYLNKTKVAKFDTYPLYVIVGMRDKAKINNITIEEYDDVSKFSYSPTWLREPDTTIEVVTAGNQRQETLNPTTGYFESGGVSVQGEPPTNFVGLNRLSSSKIDKQLQQPLRPGEIRSTFFVGANETKKIDLDYLFGQDRYVITPGAFNSKATFFTVKALGDAAETQISLNLKEQ